MEKRKALIACLLLLAVLTGGVVHADGPTANRYEDTLYVSIFKKFTARSLPYSDGDTSNVMLLYLNLVFFDNTYSNQKNSLTLDGIVFDLSDISGLTPANWLAFKLVHDINKNGYLDENDQLISDKGRLLPDGGNARIIFDDLDINFKPQSYGRYMLLADMCGVKKGDRFKITARGDLDHFITSDFPETENLTIGLLQGFITIEHYAGNRPPTLEFLAGITYKGKRGFNSKYSNMSGTRFDFAVRYTDPENKEPTEHYLLVNGTKRYEMSSNHYAKDWYKGVDFTVSVPLEFNGEKTKIKFVFKDGEDRAVGPPTFDQVVPVMPWMFVSEQETVLDTARILPGQKLELRSTVLRHIDARVNWQDITGKNIDGMTVDNIRIGTEKPFPPNKEFVITPVFITLTPAGSSGETTPAIDIAFTVDKLIAGDKLHLERTATIPSREYTVSPAILLDYRLSRTRMTLGEKIDVYLELMIDKDAKADLGLREFNVNPLIIIPDSFRVTRKDPAKDKNTGPAFLVCRFSLYTFELPSNQPFFDLPPQAIRVKSGGKVYELNLPGKTIDFVPPMNEIEVQGGFPMEFGFIPDNYSGNRQSMIFGTGSLILSSALLLLGLTLIAGSFRSISRHGGISKNELKCLRELHRNKLENALDNLDHACRSAGGQGFHRPAAESALTAVQDYLHTLNEPEATGWRSKSPRDLKHSLPESATQDQEWEEFLDLLSLAIFSEKEPEPGAFRSLGENFSRIKQKINS